MFRRSYLSCLLCLATAALATQVGSVSTLKVMNKNITPDGFSRPASLINGIHPGPVIMAKKGDRLKLNVINELIDPKQLRGTSIHWHGILQKGTNFMDGVDGVTQCPIAPSQSFLYSFNADEAGTYWYHSHFQLQYCDGVRGVLIVQDPKDPLRSFYDGTGLESTIITLAEWYHTLAPDIVGISTADSTLINGKGRFPGGPNADLAVVNVQKGKRYRFRVVSISCDPNFNFSIDGHDLTIIETDSIPTRQHTVNRLQIFAGQRYSVVLNANQPASNYWIRALPSAGSRNLSTTFANGVNSAILRYQGAPNEEPKSTQQKNQNVLVETDLHPLVNPSAPGRSTPDGADVTFNLTLDFDQAAFKFSINNASFVPPTVPVLLQIMNGASSAQDLLPKGGVFTVERNKTVQINLPSGLIGGPHPFHLDGHTFSVVKSADNPKFNFLDPVQRDVVSIGDTQGDFVAIRFRTDNPGPWIFRCHINFHYQEGLAIVFAEAPDQTAADNPPPSMYLHHFVRNPPD
ncbi:multicopper oxidase [Macrolepiota fuliginosa MF-IS2]|uniref:laccase n=1 Tax=Macrolepiota fuliginosa MF-IS2 TaxID=1400762 RepID=A0A9P5X2Y7_9AGAR|nr:multicopper oxidase [Macrolepiota fuliginosa MF-IS2]